jgi:general stress protein 26
MKNNPIKKMMKFNNYISLIMLSFLLFPLLGHCQPKALSDSTNNKIFTAAREIVLAAGTCTLISVDADGVARARAMDAFLPDEAFIVWFGTNPKSRKVGQIQGNPMVSLYYFDKATASYVLLHGKAQIVDNTTEKEKYWKKEWEAFYPNYPDGYLLIKVIPLWMEVVSESRGIIGDPVTWQPAVVSFDK